MVYVMKTYLRNTTKARLCFIIAILLLINCQGGQSTTEIPETVYDGIRSASDFAEMLETYPNGVLANRNGEHLRTQIMSFQFVEGNRVFFCTGSEKPLYAQLRAYPHVSYCIFPEDFEPVLSLNGQVVFTDDRELLDRVFAGTNYASEFIRRHYGTVDNPNLRLFYIDVIEIETYEYTGASIFSTH